MIKRLLSLSLALLISVGATAQGWPAKYKGVMLQGFYWDSYTDTQWSNLESQADELSTFFSLIWVPQSGNCGTGQSMGYNDLYWFDHNSSFGTDTQLRSMINAFKTRGTGIIADVVINHRANLSTWTDFPSETYNGVTYSMGAADICNNDEAATAGYTVTGNADTGDNWDGLRDLDHTGSNVQTVVKAYLDFLLNDLGYAGFRYDLVKGYSPSYTALYNAAAAPTYSVGEYWDGSYDAVTGWINGTKDTDGVIRSSAFDFPGKYQLNKACNNGTWNELMWRYNYTTPQPAGLIHNADMRRYAVTFVDNHDTYRDDNKVSQNIMAANAFILTMPGVPCVFLPHWQQNKAALQALIRARQTAGIHSESAVTVTASSSSVFAARVTGDTGSLFVVLGSGTATVPSGFSLVTSGTNYAVYLGTDNHALWCDTESGAYVSGTTVKLTALSTDADAKVYYTTDGSAPSATNGTLYDATTGITLTAGVTLNAILIDAAGSSSVLTRTYTLKEAFVPYTATVYVKADWPTTYFYAWDTSGTLLGTWPGTQMTATTTINGTTWYYKDFAINADDYTFNIIFNQGANTAQTVDITGLKQTVFYEISASPTNGKYTVEDVTATTSLRQVKADDGLRVQGGIGTVTLSADAVQTVALRLLTGQTLRQVVAGQTPTVITGLQAGIYLVGNRKVVVR